jgi:hypothetical protein
MKHSSITYSAGVILFAAAMVAVGTPAAQTQGYTRTGVLRCDLKPTIGLVLGSRQRMTCRFQSERSGMRETYSGTITRLGIDLGFTAGGVMSWAVLTQTAGTGRGALAGTFVGASGDIAFGLGVGANALVGGSNRSVVLQPVSVSGQVGVNLALGVAGLRLRLIH